MDAKDVRIFCEMAFKYTDYHAPTERRFSPSEIGRKLSLDEKTVRLRVKKMEEEGFIKYYQVVPNLGLLGFGHLAMYGLQARDITSKKEAIEAAQRRPGVVEIIDAVGPGFSVTLAGSSEDGLQRRAVEIANDLQVKRLFKIAERPMAEATGSPTRLDWQILEACRYDALCPATTIAEKLSITPRMVEYRIEKLLESRAGFIKAIIDVQSLKGIIFYTLVLFSGEAKARGLVQALQDAHGERLWSLVEPRPLRSGLVPRGTRDKLLFALAPRGWVVGANLFGETAGEPEAALLQALKFDGVKRGLLSILKEWIEPRRPAWIDGLVRDKIASEAPGPRAI